MPDERLAAIFAKLDDLESRELAQEEQREREMREQAEKATAALRDWETSSVALDAAIEHLNSDLGARGLYFERSAPSLEESAAIANFAVYLEFTVSNTRARTMNIAVGKYGHVNIQMGSKKTMPARTERKEHSLDEPTWREMLLTFLELNLSA